MAAETTCCATCGYVGLQPKGGGPFVEVKRECRKDGSFQRDAYPAGPQCSKNLANLPSEAETWMRNKTRDANPDPVNPDAIREVLNRARPECQRWTRWHPNCSPREHDEMLAQQIALDAQKSGSQSLALIAGLQHDYLDLKRQQDAWTKQQSDKDEQTSKRLQALEGKRHWQTIFWNGFIGIVAGVIGGAVGALLTAYLSRPH